METEIGIRKKILYGGGDNITYCLHDGIMHGNISIGREQYVAFATHSCIRAILKEMTAKRPWRKSPADSPHVTPEEHNWLLCNPRFVGSALGGEID